MRVALFGNIESPHLRVWVTALRKKQFDVLVIGPGRKPPELDCDSVRFLGPGRLKYIYGLAQSGWALSRFGPQLLHLHYLGWTSLYALFTQKPYIASPWGSDVYQAGHLRGWILRRIFRRAARITTTSATMASDLERFGVRRGDPRVATFSWGADTDMFRPLASDERESLRSELDLPHNKTIIVLPRWLTPVYQNVEIATLLGKLPKDILHGLHVCAVGGFGASRECQARLEAVLRSSGISYLMLPGPLGGQTFAKYLQCADVAISAPRTDQRSTTVLECLACVPQVVLLDCPVYQEFQASGYTLSLLPNLDPEDTRTEQVLLSALDASRRPAAETIAEGNWELLRRTESKQLFQEAIGDLYANLDT